MKLVFKTPRTQCSVAEDAIGVYQLLERYKSSWSELRAGARL
jgi:hypothetical protein